MGRSSDKHVFALKWANVVVGRQQRRQTMQPRMKAGRGAAKSATLHTVAEVKHYSGRQDNRVKMTLKHQHNNSGSWTDDRRETAHDQ